ncbi:MAG: YaiI/YqxD family protein [Methylotetracoccus sp.]|jgi:hypothetical protein|nr:YaiI/YqxD family protein [Methylotetracoccus sp.]
MRIWVDADACPAAIKDILFRAAERVRVPLTLVANQPLRVPPSPWIKTIRVPGGFDAADDRIVQEIEPNDLVVTADIPLAAVVINRDAHALNPRGAFYAKDNVREHLALRNLREELRASGVEIGGPAAFNHSDRQAFANQLDRFLTRRAT